MVDDCVFCKIVKGELPSERVFESDNFIVVRDAFPKVEGHSLIIPKRHFDDFMGMDKALDPELLEVAREIARKEKWDEFNLVTNQGKSAGQIVFHTHFHILPRHKDDGFRFGL